MDLDIVFQSLRFTLLGAPEEFQKRLLDALECIICGADDILVYVEGDTKEDALKDHDWCLVALMEHCASKNIKLQVQTTWSQVHGKHNHRQ